MNELHNLMTLPDKVRVRKGTEHTPAEIEAQPRLWTENFKILEKRREEIWSFLDARTFSRKKPRVILAGAGSSAYIGLSAQNLLRHRWQLDVEARPTTDMITHWSSILLKDADNTLVSFSRSGKSPESTGAFFLAERFCPRISHIIVTCNKDGKLAELAEAKNNALLLLLSEDTNDKGLAMTASFTTMLMTAQFLAHAKDPETYEPIVKDLSEATKLLFENYSDLIKGIAETDFRRAIFLGSGCLYGCAVESSLKLQEMTAGRIVCKADTFLGVRHGPEVVIDKETLVVYFLSTHPFIRRYELDLADEIEAKGLGMKKVAVCDKTDGEIERCADQTIEFNREGMFSIPDLYRPVMDVTVGQLIGLFKSLALGLKPDNPSEKGVITRVVKGVSIYDDKAFERDRKFRTIAS